MITSIRTHILYKPYTFILYTNTIILTFIKEESNYAQVNHITIADWPMLIYDQTQQLNVEQIIETAAGTSIAWAGSVLAP